VSATKLKADSRDYRKEYLLYNPTYHLKKDNEERSKKEEGSRLRYCLRCDKQFRSEHSGNRVCDACSQENDSVRRQRCKAACEIPTAEEVDIVDIVDIVSRGEQ